MPTPESYQARFHRRWGHLAGAHVRALAWLLDSSDLLDSEAPQWKGRVATLGPVSPEVADWLVRLDADSTPLDAALGSRPCTRLGLYAEKLMAVYFEQQGRLVAHGLQVRASRNDTIGEFDFLLEAGPGGLEHIEFATKFYLLDGAAARELDALVGPNLADSLGVKMRKVFERQLMLGSHPAAQPLLPRPVTLARALVKGWLFYPFGDWPALQGIAAQHCRGFWCALDEVEGLAGEQFVILPKLQWLAPFRSTSTAWLLDRAGLATALLDQFQTSNTPLLVASVRERGGAMEEVERGFIVPDDWRERAARVRLAKAL